MANANTESFLTHLGGLWAKSRSSLIMGARSLWLHKLRTFLSVMGIIIGTSAVISLMSFGKGTWEDALNDIKRAGATNIHIRSVKPPDKGTSQNRSFFIRYGLTREDYEQLSRIPTVIRHVPMRIFLQEIRVRERMVLGRIVGTTENYRKVNRFRLAAGRFICDADNMAAEGDNSRFRNVCVLRANVASQLFPFEAPLHKSVSINNQNYIVVGIVANRMPIGSSSGKLGEEFNNDVYISLNACRARFGDKIYIRQSGSRSGEVVQLHQITLTVDKMSEVRPTAKMVQSILERNTEHRKKRDFMVTYPLDRLEEAERTSERFQWLMLLIASISLVVGGIGIMNIMLATVTERTREIGIRRALGAKRADIILQFIIEAVLQTSLGGFLGMLIGLAIVYGIPVVLPVLGFGRIPALLDEWSIVYSVGSSIAVGVVFGLYPAVRASRLDPIEALRHM